MSSHLELVEKYLFEYLDASLEPSLARAVEQAIDSCDESRALYQQALEARQWEHQWQQQTVPDWHRTRFAVSKPRRQNFSWLNWSSLATSALALFLVVFRVEFVSNENGLMISFNGKASEAQLVAVVDQQLNQMAQRQVAFIENRLVEFQLEAANNQEQLADVVLQQARNERVKDINAVVAVWNQQREFDREKVNQRVDNIVDNQIENNRYLNRVLKVADTGYQ